VIVNSILSKDQLQMLCNVAIEAAQQAGQWIETFDRDNLQQTFKNSGNSKASQVVTEVDHGSEEIIRQHLQPVSEPLDIAFVGEESFFCKPDDAHERFEKPYFWCVDPLDGTLAYANGHAGYAISIALVEQSGKSLIGVVYDPASQVLYHAIRGQGSYQNLTPFSQTSLRQNIPSSKLLTVYADASFKTHANYQPAVNAIEYCAQILRYDGVTFSYGSGAVKNACHVITSNQACYLKLPKIEEGGGSIWDYAATACIAHESGCSATNIFGQPLALNRHASTFMNHEGILFASNNQIARCLIDAL